jgi:hypothetical protein
VGDLSNGGRRRINTSKYNSQIGSAYCSFREHQKSMISHLLYLLVFGSHDSPIRGTDLIVVERLERQQATRRSVHTNHSSTRHTPTKTVMSIRAAQTFINGITMMTYQSDPDRSLLSGFELSTINIDGLSMSEDQMMRNPIEGTKRLEPKNRPTNQPLWFAFLFASA